MLSSLLGQKQETTICTAFCNYLALEVEVLEVKDFQTFRNEAVKLLSNNGRRTWLSATAITATDTFTKLKIQTSTFVPQTATAASTSYKGIHLNHLRDTDAVKPHYLARSAEPSGNQRKAAAIQMAANILPSILLVSWDASECEFDQEVAVASFFLSLKDLGHDTGVRLLSSSPGSWLGLRLW